MPAPRPERRPFVRTVHGHPVTDPYAWLRDPEDPDVQAHCERENAYTAHRTSALAPLRERIFAEIASRTLQTDLSVPDYTTDTQGRAWWFYARTTIGSNYPVYCRCPATSRDDIPDPSRPIDGELQVLDLNAEADGFEHFELGDFEVSPDGDRLIWTADPVGEEVYDVHVRDLISGADEVVVHDVASAGWLGSSHLVYTVCDDAWRPYQLYRRRLGDTAPATLMFEEPDERFWLGFDTSADEQWLMIASASKTSTEFQLLAVADPEGAPRVVAPRTDGLEYDVEPAGDRLYIVHNRSCPDFELAECGLAATSPDDWRTVVAGSTGRRFLGVTAYATHLVWSWRVSGLPQVVIAPRLPDGSLGEPVPLPGDGLRVVTADDDEYDSDRIRYVAESYIEPAVVMEHTFAGDERILKVQPVLPDPEGRPFSSDDYRQWRTWATAADGTRIPVSLVSRRGVPLDGTAPALIYAYGAYETALDPGFSIPRLSLLDRGVVVAYAHVRGGGEFGRSWYEAGRLAAKATTFTDLVACAHHLIDEGVCAADRLVARGFSAGGLTVGAAVNLEPGLFRAVHVGVGFVDPLTSMLDPEAPLTITERDEWGDPLADEAAYATMAAYSPYENVHPAPYPAVLATAALHDQRVSFAEPAKWVAALRDATTSGNDVLLRVETAGGHGGLSGRYAAWRDEAFELAWILQQVGAGTTVV